MRQTARLLATVAALAFPGAAGAAPPTPQVHAPSGLHHTPNRAPERLHGHGRPFLHALVPFDSYDWPVAVPAAEGRRTVTHDFIDPQFRAPPPHRVPRSIEVLSDEPVLFREPPHVIELGRPRHRRAPITVVRRGVVSQE